MRDCIAELAERNIDVSGEEFYAVMSEYISKINSYMTGKNARFGDKELLRLARVYEVTRAPKDKVALDDYFDALLDSQDETIKKTCLERTSPEDKIRTLHAYATALGKKAKRDFSLLRSKRLSLLDEHNIALKGQYKERLEDYKVKSEIKYSEKAMADFLEMAAQRVGGDKEELKARTIASIDRDEDKFLSLQRKFVNRVVELSVEDECQVLFAKETQPDIERIQ